MLKLSDQRFITHANGCKLVSSKRFIAVGSTNPVKINAVRDAVSYYYKDIAVKSIKVRSGVSSMPQSKNETRIGAKNRAYNALIESNAWLGVGNEGGICRIGDHWYLFSTTCITDGMLESWGCETLIQLPDKLANQVIKNNHELGTVLDQNIGTTNIKQKEGAVGYLTKNKITRGEVFKMGALMALVPWI